MTIFNLNQDQTILLFAIVGVICWFIASNYYHESANKRRAKRTLSQSLDLTKVRPSKLHYVLDAALTSKVTYPGVAEKVWTAFQTERRNAGLPQIYRDLTVLRQLIKREGDIAFFTTEDIDMLINMAEWEFLKELVELGYEMNVPQKQTFAAFAEYTPSEFLKIEYRSQLKAA